MKKFCHVGKSRCHFHVVRAKKKSKVKRNSKKLQKLPLKFPKILMQASFPVTENKNLNTKFKSRRLLCVASDQVIIGLLMLLLLSLF